MVKLSKRVLEWEEEAATLRHSQKLFSIQQAAEFKTLHHCQRELEVLETVWEFIDRIEKHYTACEKLRWSSVDIEAMGKGMDDIIEEFSPKIESMKNVAAFGGIMDKVQKFKETLPLVHELTSPDMRPRHWKLFTERTRVRSVGMSGA